MKNQDFTWSKRRYIGLALREYVLRALGKEDAAYELMYQRDSLIEKGSQEFLFGYVTKYLLPGMKVLDIACADGTLLDDLSDHSLYACGLEYNRTRTLRARSKGRNVVRADMHDVPFRPQSFDVVIASGILQQTTSRPEALLCEWSNMLKDEGVLLLMVSNIPAARRKWLRTPGERWKVIGYHSQYKVIYDRHSFIELIERANLNIETLIDHPTPAEPQDWVAVCRQRRE